MRRCFELAALGGDAVKENPKVGAVIVHERQIIGEGYHQVYGGPHAEVNAINSVSAAHSNLLTSATLYISLEPCFHFGKTPPCVDLILRHGIPRVVISVIDPNPLVAGKSVQKLRNAQVEVLQGILATEGKKLIANFSKQFHES